MIRRRRPRTGLDVVIVGARVAGASTALLLARAGLRVLVVDRARRGSDTLSTHALMRGGGLQLRRWGLLDRVIATAAPPIRRVTFHYGTEVMPVSLKPYAGVDALYAPRRTVLDSLLVDAAEAAGAQFRFGVTMVDLARDAVGRAVGVVLRDHHGGSWTERTPLVVGADGRGSLLANRVEAPIIATGAYTGAYLYGYWPAADLDGYHWYYGEGLSAGAIPTNDSLACVFIGGPPATVAAAMRRSNRRRVEFRGCATAGRQRRPTWRTTAARATGTSPSWRTRCQPESSGCLVRAELLGPQVQRPSPRHPLGRDQELARIDRLIDAAGSGRGRTVFISGPAGIGETAILRWLDGRAEKRGLRVGMGTAAAIEGAWPYAPVLEALADLCRRHPVMLDGLADEYRAEIEGALRGTAADRTGDSRHQRLFISAAELLRLAAWGAGAALIVDDAHDADEASLRLLHYLSRVAVSERLMIVVAHRPWPLRPQWTRCDAA